MGSNDRTDLFVPQNMTMNAGMQSLYLRVNVTNAAGLSMLSPSVTFRYKGPSIESVSDLASGQTVSGAGLPPLPLFFAYRFYACEMALRSS